MPGNQQARPAPHRPQSRDPLRRLVPTAGPRTAPAFRPVISQRQSRPPARQTRGRRLAHSDARRGRRCLRCGRGGGHSGEPCAGSSRTSPVFPSPSSTAPGDTLHAAMPGPLRSFVPVRGRPGVIRPYRLRRSACFVEVLPGLRIYLGQLSKARAGQPGSLVEGPAHVAFYWCRVIGDPRHY